ncbi:MAG: hypothetical protein N2645_19820 [Clostridia bacterium]|nr:hypothetical protein [Clostridia bacterium]
MPTGLPTGPTVAPPPMPSVPLISPAQLTPTLPVTQAMEADLSTQTVMSAQYTQGYLKSKIGSRVKVEFLIGTNMLVDREGTLVEVGTSYIVIREVDTDDLLLCDMYSIKFVRFYY